MKKVLFIIILSGVLCVPLLFAQNAEIKIDIDRTIGTVNKNIYGNIAEHLGRCIYSGIYDENSKLSDQDGF